MYFSRGSPTEHSHLAGVIFKPQSIRCDQALQYTVNYLLLVMNVRQNIIRQMPVNLVAFGAYKSWYGYIITLAVLGLDYPFYMVPQFKLGPAYLTIHKYQYSTVYKSLQTSYK